MKLLVGFFFIATGAYASDSDLSLPLQTEDEMIVGGEHPKTDAAPYQVSLQTASGAHMCGGAIIAAWWILTAAHCLESPTDIRKIVTGTQNLNLGGTIYHPKGFFFHPRYVKNEFHDDIALIKLRTPIKFDETTQPIGFDYNQLTEGTVLTVTGFRNLWEGGAYSDELRTLNLTYIGYEECKSEYRGSPIIKYGHVCTLNQPGDGSCNGEAGSPLVHNGKLVAIFNWVYRPCASGYPSVHARVSYYHDFIRATINPNHKH